MSMGSLADPFGEVRRIHPLFGAATVESKSGWVGSSVMRSLGSMAFIITWMRTKFGILDSMAETWEFGHLTYRGIHMREGAWGSVNGLID